MIKNTGEQLSKMNPYFLIGASISGTLLILHIHKLWKQLKLRFFNHFIKQLYLIWSKCK